MEALLFSLYLSDGLSSLDLPLGVGDAGTVELVGLLHSEETERMVNELHLENI